MSGVLSLNDRAGYTTPILKGFQRTELLVAGGKATVTFALSQRDLSHWDTEKGDWVAVAQVTAHIGESSGDIRQTLPDLDVAGATASQPQARSDPYDCAAGFSNWQAGWSDGKKSWCCEHAQKGCEQPAGGGGGFCCFSAGGPGGCGACPAAAVAAADSVCGASAGDCEGCGGGSTWCPVIATLAV
ncbi:unnamed protein product [Prorocentrum cordatum]|uniref:Fibronectin type III-like domain-containing protein n=1 Tax=Prorocentrum cordatum TaxID=2364126 RepID=A0ABN9RJZ7_9DINO|nr:unnamed protein product [Polarella glacialis]